MPRSEARLHLGVWEGVKELSPLGKLYYFVVLTEPTLNQAGVGAVREGRWAKHAGLSADEAAACFREVQESRHIVVDPDTEEVLVRTLIRNDKVANQPNVLKAACAAAKLVQSPKLRKVLAEELRKLPAKPPDRITKGGGRFVHPDPHAVADELDPPQDPTPGRADSAEEAHPGVWTDLGTTTGLNPSRSDPERFAKGSKPKGTGTLPEPPGVGEGEGEAVPVLEIETWGVARAREKPPRRPRCPQHQHLAEDDPGPNCVPCRDVRVTIETTAGLESRSRNLEQLMTVRRCQLCDAEGWRYEPGARVPLTPYERCDHRQLRSAS